MPTNPRPIAPVINLNGTSPENLCMALNRARSLAANMIMALEDTEPHGRDFQTAEPGMYDIARNEHVARLTDVRKLLDALTEIQGQILEQLESRSAR